MSRFITLVALSGIALVAAFLSNLPEHGAEAKRHGSAAYIALGDEVALGVGLDDPNDESYVPLFHEFLESRRGLHSEVELVNLPADNASIFDVAGIQLPLALAEIEERRSDRDKKNDVRVVTIDAGLVDLSGSLLVCMDQPIGDCAGSFRETLVWHEFFIDYILDALRTAGGPNLQIIVMTNYNPFLNAGCQLSSLAHAWDVALEGDPALGINEGMNDITRRLAPQYGARVADVFGLMAPEHLPALCDTNGPTAEGHVVIAAEFTRAFRDKTR